MKKPNFFNESAKFIFVSTAIIMLLTHGFCFMNIMYSHDSLNFADPNGYGKVSLGRWLYPFLVHRRQIATPWLMGMLCILYVSFAVVLVSKVFDLDKIQGLCVAILFASNLTLVSLFCTYIFDADADCLSLLLACFAVYSFKNFPKTLRVISSAVSCALCLSLYQAYICVAIGLFILLIIHEAINSNCWNDILRIMVNGLKALISLFLGTMLYIPLMHVATHVYRTKLSTGYNGAGNLNSLKLKDIINSIPIAYKYLAHHFIDITAYNTISIVIVNCIVVILIIFSLIYHIYKNRFLGSLVIIVPCLLIMPLGLNAIIIVSFGVMHQLMIFAFCLVYIIPIVINKSSAETEPNNPLVKKTFMYKSFIQITTIFSIFFIGLNNFVYSNGAYVYKKLVYDNTALHAQTIWKDINNLEGYVEGTTPVVFMGSFTSANLAYDGSVGKRYNAVLTGASNSSITYPETTHWFYSNILGRQVNIDYNNAGISQDSEYIEMPEYPMNGYCKIIKNRVVVKLQN